MIVHLTGSTQNIEEDLPYLRHIIKLATKNNHEIAYDWVETAHKDLTQDPAARAGDEDWGRIFQENMAAIARADVVIIEATNMRFAQGYQAAIALQQKKPLLILLRNKTAKGKLVSGISDELMSVRTYTDKEKLDEIIEVFLKDNLMTAKDMRFNFFIDRPIHNYLRWASFKTGKTKAEILRELVQKEIENKKDF